MSKKSDWALAVAALACVALTCTRAVGVFHYGPFVYTSGREDESLFAIWKWINRLPVYGNAFAPPFAQSYFNWLFYWVYGGVGSLLLAAGKLDFSALPLISRCLTLASAAVSMLVVYRLLGSLSPMSRIAGSVIIAFNPLIGFWAMTARPDVGALTLALIGAWCVRRSDRFHSSMWLGTAFLAFYCSWAFKQTYLAAFAATVLHLYLSGRRKPALWFGAVAVLAIGLTFVLGTPEYRYAAIFSQTHMGLLPSNGLNNIGRAILKAPLLLAGLVSVILAMRQDRTNFFAWWTILSMPLMLIASAKAGASDNYFFEPAAACSILFLLRGRYTTAAGVAQIIAPLLILAGFLGWAFAKPEPGYASLKSELAHMNGSVIITDVGANVPWIQERPPYFVLSTTYLDDRARGTAFAFGGVAGMVRSGRINWFVCPRDKVNEPFDGIVPASLRKVKEDSNWVYFSTQTQR